MTTDKLSFDIDFKVRFYSEQQLIYHVKGVDATATSNGAIFVGASLNRLIYEHRFNMIHMRVGLGADLVDTNLHYSSQPPPADPGAEKSYAVTTLHAVYGFSAMHQFKNGMYLGAVTEFHLVPNGLSSRLKHASMYVH